MILTVNAGNTSLFIGGYDDGGLRMTARLCTASWRTGDEWTALLGSVLSNKGVDAGNIEGAILSSVVPQITRALALGINGLCGSEPLVVGPGVKTGLDILIDNPAQLGSDLVCTACGALARYRPPVIIFDMGTATSVSVLDAKGRFRGGAIVPGLTTSVEALSQRTAQLPHVDLVVPSRVVGSNTVECMQSGALHGAAAMVDGLSQRMEEEIGEFCQIILTGGTAELVLPIIRRKVAWEPNLLLEGLIHIYRRNQHK